MTGQNDSERLAELHAALDLLGRKFAEEEAWAEINGHAAPLAVTYSRNGYKITVKRDGQADETGDKQ